MAKQRQRNRVAATGIPTLPWGRCSGILKPRNPSSYYRARYYDSQAGRFLSEDPLGFNAKQKNFYPYVSNSPLNFRDPFGLKPGNKLENFGNCVEGCLKTMLSSNFCTLKQNLKRAAVAAPLIGVGTCTFIVASEPYLAPAFVACAGLTTASTFGVITNISLGRWNIENLSSGAGCTAFCDMNELK